MSPYYSDEWLTVHQGDCREVMASMDPASVHCVVTSPPYWGLRDYGTATWVGGDEACDHVRPNARKAHERRASTLGGGVATVAAQDAGVNAEATCGRCGAQREDGQLGLEPTPEAYVANMVAVFREVRRVLRDDGTVWLNLGDSYAANGVSGLAVKGETSTLVGTANVAHTAQRKAVPPGLKPKDLVGIPWMVAFALRADGWYLRSDIIWSKPNPMPESVTDRPTKSHEYLFLLSKSARYYFDAEAVREDWADDRQGAPGGQRRWCARYVGSDGTLCSTHNGRFSDDAAARCDHSGNPGRNIRSVWTVATQPYPGAHFATFPEKLIEPCIKAGSSERGVCSECGAPWEREVQRSTVPRDVFPSSTNRRPGDGANDARTANGGMSNGSPIVVTTGWRPPDCGHYDHFTGLHEKPVPAAILDPFAGSGTTGRVAQRLGRRAVLIDLNADYLVQAMDRNQDIPLGLETA